MLRCDCRIEIERFDEESDKVLRWTIRRVHELKITADTSTLADTCRIEMPKNITWGLGEQCPIRRGDEVSVWLGYNDKLKLRFKGFVQSVKVGEPTVITAEDWVFLLRETRIKSKLYTKASLGDILADIVPKTVRVKTSGEIKIGSWKTTAETVAGEISLLCESYPITAFFELEDDQQPTLFVFTSWIDGRRLAGDFAEGKNIISHSLEYRKSDDVKVRIRGISTLPNGKKIEYVEGDGQESVKNYYNLSEEELKAVVKAELKRQKWEGLKGSFETFGSPIVRKADKVDLMLQGEKRGRYIVKGVEITFGQGGYRQRIETQRKISE